jgi:S1-C subfamily serine protease
MSIATFLIIQRRIASPGLLLILALGLWIISDSALAFTSGEANNVAVYAKVAPSVVNITTEACEPESFYCSMPSETASASGIVLRKDGMIVTNYHVVSGAQTLQVTAADGRHYNAVLVASSAVDDLAVIRVDVGDKPLQAIAMGDSESLRVGEKVLAIGNPFGLGQSLSVGNISMLNRDIKKDGSLFQGLIQTDAAINPGNSGGALVNSSGELVGMNTAILRPTGSSVRIGFAIPVNRIAKVAPGLMSVWQKWVGWFLAVLLVLWIARKIYVFR